MPTEQIRLIRFDDGLECYAGNEAEARFGYREIFHDDLYRAWDLPEAPLVLDIGAGIGLFTLFVKRRWPRARVIAVEPVPQNVALLRRNIALHGLDGVTVKAVSLGAAAAPAVPFAHLPQLPGSSTFHPEQYGPQQALLARQLGAEQAARLFATVRVEVPMERLSALLPDPPTDPVDLVKIDVEGAELDVLAGIDDGDWPRIAGVLVETSDRDGVAGRVAADLRAHGLRVARVDAPYMWPELEFRNVTGRR